MNFGTVVVIAGFTGIFSFSFLAAAIGSEYWYIIKVNKQNLTNLEDLDSYSGLWRINEGKNARSHFIHPFTEDTSNYTKTERHLLNLHKVIVILLPLSLVLLVLGGICLFTLSGVSIYISYSQQALQELERQLGAEQLSHVQVSFGWSLGLAWLSYGLEVATGLLLLLATRIAHLQRIQSVNITMHTCSIVIERFLFFSSFSIFDPNDTGTLAPERGSIPGGLFPSVGPSALSCVLLGHKAQFEDSQLGVLLCDAQVPHGPDRAPDMREHEDAHALPQRPVLALRHGCHALAELDRGQQRVAQAEAQDVGLHSSHVHL
ncbi:hypothetical protein JZ751_027563, partial [Albula glossodonta]